MDKNSFSAEEQSLLDKCSLNLILLTSTEKKLVNKVSRTLGINAMDVPISDVLSFDENYDDKCTLSDRRAVISIEQGIKENIDNYGIEKIQDNHYHEAIIKYLGEQDLSWQEINDKMTSDVKSFQKHLNAKDLTIFKHRFGLSGVPESTLDETGKMFSPSLTRERIRQLEDKIMSLFMSFSSLSRRYLLLKIYNETNEDLFKSLSGFISSFSEESSAIRFLSHSCNIPKKEMNNFFYPKFSILEVNKVFTEIKSPVSKDELSNSIAEMYDYSLSQVNNILCKSLENGDFIINKNGLYEPRNLNSEQSIYQTLLNLKDGAHFTDIYKLANKMKYRSKKFDETRTEHGISNCVDTNLIYLSAKGTYRSVIYAQITEEMIQDIISIASKVLASDKRNQLNLLSDIYDSRLEKYDYHIVRHIVRTHGYKENIYFFGASSTDTVSLDSEYSLVNVNKTIINAISRKPLTPDSIFKSCGLRSHSYLLNQLNELSTSGQITRIDGKYTLSSKVYAKNPIKKISDEIEILMNDAARPVEIDTISKMLVMKFNIARGKEWCKGLICYANYKLNLDLKIKRNIVFNLDFEAKSVSEVIRKYMAIKDDPDFIREKVSKEIKIEDSTLRRIINTRHLNSEN